MGKDLPLSTFCNIFIIKMLKSKTYEELRLCSVNNELITLSITIFQLLNPLFKIFAISTRTARQTSFTKQNDLRWLLLLTALVAILRASIGIARRRPWTTADGTAALVWHDSRRPDADRADPLFLSQPVHLVGLERHRRYDARRDRAVHRDRASVWNAHRRGARAHRPGAQSQESGCSATAPDGADLLRAGTGRDVDLDPVARTARREGTLSRSGAVR